MSKHQIKEKFINFSRKPFKAIYKTVEEEESTIALVESIPIGLEDLRGQIPNVEYTENVLKDLVKNSKKSIYLTAMYWNLTHKDSDKCKSMKHCLDISGFSEKDFKYLKADWGEELYENMKTSIKKGVKFNIIQSPGFEGGLDESSELKKINPNNVNIYNIKMPDWYKVNGKGEGIMHQKIWVFDEKHIYLGSANMDWLSLSQVKEMGIVIRNSSELANDVINYLNNWIQFSQLNPNKNQKLLSTYNSDKFAVKRTVPCWSESLPVKCDDGEFLIKTQYNKDNQFKTKLNGKLSEIFISGSPTELKGDNRTSDLNSLIYTIHSAKSYVYLSVMDFIPSTLYITPPIWWNELIYPLLQASITKQLNVKLLISKWNFTDTQLIPYLKYIKQLANVSTTGFHKTKGTFEIKLFEIPGWEDTNNINRKYPGHSRVNHNKYIVTDQRANIGTNNMSWGYFYNTAGSSVNTNNTDIVSNLTKVFERDWNSKYSHNLEEKSSGNKKSILIYIIIGVIIILLILFFILLKNNRLFYI